MFCQWRQHITKSILAISAIMVALIFTQCATPVAPKGGPKDEIPPSVVDEESTPNPMINFDLDEIRITLDEWVRLDKPAQQIVISPPIEPRPFAKLDRKSVVIPINLENIQDNTTYTINFGEAIQDITERNPLVNHTFVFSKGDYVDSLSVTGTVIDAANGLPLSGARFILHDNQTDTAITNLLPSYFTTTDASGRFKLDFLRPDTFRGYAIVEAEFGNFRYDVGEKFGFLDKPIILGDTVAPNVRITAYLPLMPIRAGSPRFEYDTWKIPLSRKALNIDLGGDTSAIDHWNQRADTIYLWHLAADTLEIEVLEEGIPFDTVKLLPYVEGDQFISVSLMSKNRHPDDPMNFNVATPIASVDERQISVALGDSVDIKDFSFEINSDDPHEVLLGAKWADKSVFHVRVLPGAITDMFGNSNDTMLFVVSFDERINFGLLSLTITGLDSTLQYLVKLRDNQTVLEERVIRSKADSVLVFNRLPAKVYMAQIVEDRNANGIRDVGDFETKRQPERIFIEQIKGMRPGWDLDLTITWPKK